MLATKYILQAAQPQLHFYGIPADANCQHFAYYIKFVFVVVLFTVGPADNVTTENRKVNNDNSLKIYCYFHFSKASPITYRLAVTSDRYFFIEGKRRGLAVA